MLSFLTKFFLVVLSGVILSLVLMRDDDFDDPIVFISEYGKIDEMFYDRRNKHVVSGAETKRNQKEREPTGSKNVI